MNEPKQSPESKAQNALAEMISHGYGDKENLREILVAAWLKPTKQMVNTYVRQHTGEPELLRGLIEIALEGWDNGDAPTIAAGFLPDFPSELLTAFESDLQRLSREPWPGIRDPAILALGKIKGK